MGKGGGSDLTRKYWEVENVQEMIIRSCWEQQFEPLALSMDLQISRDRMEALLKGKILPTEGTLAAIARILFWSDKERNRALELLHTQLDTYMSSSFGYVELS